MGIKKRQKPLILRPELEPLHAFTRIIKEFQSQKFQFYPFLSFRFKKIERRIPMERLAYLKKELGSVAVDQQRINILVDLIKILYRNEPNQALQFAKELIEVGKRTQCNETLARGYNYSGVIQKQQGNFQEAKMLISLAKEICEASNLEINLSSIECNLANIYILEGDFSKAIDHLFSAIKFAEKNELHAKLGTYYSNLGVIYEEQGKLDDAMKYHVLSLQNYERSENEISKAYTYSNIANIYIRLEQYQEALVQLDLSFAIRSAQNDIKGKAYTLSQKGQVLYELNEDSSALSTLFQAIDLQESVNDLEGMVESYLVVSNIYYKRKRIEGAISFASKSLSISKDLGANLLIKKAALLLSDSYHLKKDYAKAYIYFKEYTEIKDQIFNEEKTKTIQLIQSRFEAEKKDQQIEQLNKEQDLLKSVNEELNLFASKASHDLKAPLRLINAFSKILNDRYRTELDDKGSEMLVTIADSSKRMGNMLDDLLRYAVAGLQEGDSEPIDLNNILQIVQNNLYLQIKNNEALIESDILPILLGSSTNFIQLFQNLISNSIKFRTTKQPRITIHCKEEENHICFHYQDNGIGIAEEHQALIFDIFHRVHPREKYEGTGIGLATCKKIIENLGGQIWIKSKVNHGSQFYFTVNKKYLSFAYQ